MLISHSHILEARKLKDGNVMLCYIQIGNRSVKYFNGQAAPHTTNRWMQAEHWAMFDAQLEIFFGNHASNKIDEKPEHTIQLNTLISVRVKKSLIPVDILQKCCLNAPLNWKIAHAFEFLIEYKDQDVIAKPLKENFDDYLLRFENDGENENHEYEPPYISSQADGAQVPYIPSPKTNKKPKIDINSISETPDDDLIYQRLHHEERYSPKPVLLNSSLDKVNESPPTVPAYKASRMKTKKHEKPEAFSNPDRKLKNSEQQLANNEQQHANSEHQLADTEQQLSYSDHGDEPKIRENSKKRQLIFDDDNKSKAEKCKTDNKSRDNEKSKRHDRREHSSSRNYNSSHRQLKKKTKHDDRKYKALTDDLDTNQFEDTKTSSEKRKRPLVNYNADSLRRSSRSPVKPKRFVEESRNKDKFVKSRSKSRSPKHLNKKSNNHNEDLFGSDDDDAKLHEDFVTQKSDKMKIKQSKAHKESSSDSTKKKRKRPALDCSSEKQSMGNWLGKKTAKPTSTTSSSRHNDGKSSTSNVNAKKSKPSLDSSISSNSSPPALPPIPYLSKKEIEEQMVLEKIQIEKNHLITEVLEQLAGPAPEKVDTLTIRHLTSKEILSSFERYKPKLDAIFERNVKKSHQIKGYDGINNYVVMSLIEQDRPLKMMDKLQDAYEPDCVALPTHTALFANAMMPEWILCLFMDEHNMSRDQALKQIKAQDDYNLHLKAQLEESMPLD